MKYQESGRKKRDILAGLKSLGIRTPLKWLGITSDENPEIHRDYSPVLIPRDFSPVRVAR